MKRFFLDVLIFGAIVLILMYFVPEQPKQVVTTGTSISIPDTVRIETVKMDTTKVDSLKHEISLIARKLYRAKRKRYHLPDAGKTMPKINDTVKVAVKHNDTLKVKIDSTFDKYESVKTLRLSYGLIKSTSYGLTPADSIRIAYQFDANKAYLEKHPRYYGLNKREWMIAGASAGVILFIMEIFRR